MKKRVLSFVLAIYMVIIACPNISYAFSADFDIRDGVLWEYLGNGGEVVVPEGVTSIRYRAFTEHGDSVTSVILPEGVTEIESEAFSSCGLYSITIPSTTTYIGRSAFDYCRNLQSINIPDSVTHIDDSVFWECSSLQTARLPESVSYLGDNVFYKCSNLRTVTLPQNITEIGRNFFESCASLTEISLPAGLTSIGSFAFSRCSSLSKLDIPSSVTSIGDSAIQACTNLTSICIPRNVTQIGSFFLAGDKGLQSITVDVNNPSFCSKDGVLYNKDITKIIAYPPQKRGVCMIPESVTELGDGVFNSCNTLDNITLPAGLTRIGENAFWCCTGLTNIKIPHGVTEIAKGAFTECGNLSSISIPTSVTKMGEAVLGFDRAIYENYYTGDVYYAGTKEQWNLIAKDDYSFSKANIHFTDPVQMFRITFDPNGGNVNTSSKVVLLPGWYGELPIPTRKDYRFDGWFTSASGGTQITSDTTVNLTSDQTLYAHWTYAPTSYTVTFNSNGGSVDTPSKTVANGGTYGDLPTPTWSNYKFDGWFTSANGGTQITSDTIVNLTSNQTLYAHWTSAMDPYNLGDETYSFDNYDDFDSPGGHCFGMSITSAGYHNDLLDIRIIGGNANTPLYSFSRTQSVMQPICYYQGIQGSYSNRATVAGGSFYLSQGYNIASDWQEVVNYVSNHNFDSAGVLQIGFRKRDEGGHAINFLRYENVNGQDRIYAYDNNFPSQETYFYRDSSGRVRQTPKQSFSGAIDCIALRDCRTYFNSISGFDSTHVLYMAKDAASVQGCTYSYMDGSFADEEYVMYEIPANQDQVIIVPKRDNATFTYMDKEYSFGKITDETRGELKLASSDDGSVDTNVSFQIVEDGLVTPTVTLNKTTLTLTEGGGESLTATVMPDNAANKNVTWTSSDPSVAIVSDGKVMAVKTGTATITVTTKDGGNKATCTVTVLGNINISVTSNGSVTTPATSAQAGTEITITAMPDSGYMTDRVSVTDSSGKSIPVTNIGAGTYTFTMPASNVTVIATFVSTVGPTETPTPTPKPWKNPFPDVSNTAWYIKAVEYVVTEGLMSGYPNGKFGPNDNISRAEFAQIIYNKAGRPGAGTSVFSDVKAGQWYANAITWAAEQQVVSGIGNNQFAPNRDITREELATMLWRYAKSPKPLKTELDFADKNKVSGFAKEAILWANENGIVNGKGNGILDPKGKATRAETAQMLMNYLKK